MHLARLSLVWSLLALSFLTGCESGEFNHYTAPEVTGRVLAADTRQPLANVQVSRGEAASGFQPFGPPKGGQLITQPAPVLTGADGRFTLPARSVFAVFRSAGWWSAPVAFQRAGYETFSTNYTAASVVTNTAAGPPLVETGDILLQPVAR